MTDRHTEKVQQQFSEHAREFVVSKVHAQGASLSRLLELAQSQRSWKVLDIATGGGHTALTFSRHVEFVAAIDLTHPMLILAREFVQNHDHVVTTFAQSDAERLCFPENLFDCVTCRIAPHHFSNVQGFVNECHRVLAHDGVFALADNISSGEAQVAEYVNAIEKLRDPTHHWAYSLDDWHTFLETAGVKITHSEVINKTLDFDDWTDRMGVRDNHRLRLKALLIQCPDRVKQWLQPTAAQYPLQFQIAEAILTAHKIGPVRLGEV